MAQPHAELLAVVKADAYGHSLAICAPAAVRAGARWLGVTSVEEGIAARRACPDARILTLSGFFPGETKLAIDAKITPVVWLPEQIEELASAAREAGSASLPIHIEIDTGMSRQGASINEIPRLIELIESAPALRLEAVHTHLYAADESDGVATHEQLAVLDQALVPIFAAGMQPEWLCAGASAALLNGGAADLAQIAAKRGMKAMLRPGLALYGVAPPFAPDEPAPVADARAKLQPVLSWKTRITAIRNVQAGAVVGYNATFVATEPMRLALLPVGYADGLDRQLGNRFSLLVRGERAPLVGRVSMDLAVLDVTEIPAATAGDEVVIIGSQGGEMITSMDHAQASGTIPWEVFTRIGARVPRVAV